MQECFHIEYGESENELSFSVFQFHANYNGPSLNKIREEVMTSHDQKRNGTILWPPSCNIL
jgi:hypothetical protein